MYCRMDYANQHLLQEAKEPQPARVNVVDWVICAICIKIQRLRASETNDRHTCRIDLRKPSLLRVVMTIVRIVQSGSGTAIMGREPSISCAGGFSIDRSSKR